MRLRQHRTKLQKKRNISSRRKSTSLKNKWRRKKITNDEYLKLRGIIPK